MYTSNYWRYRLNRINISPLVSIEVYYFYLYNNEGDINPDICSFYKETQISDDSYFSITPNQKLELSFKSDVFILHPGTHYGFPNYRTFTQYYSLLVDVKKNVLLSIW